MALGSTQPLTEMSTRRISWGPLRNSDDLPPSCPDVTKSGNFNFLEPSKPVTGLIYLYLLLGFKKMIFSTSINNIWVRGKFLFYCEKIGFRLKRFMRTLLLFHRLISHAFNVHYSQYVGQMKPFITSSSRSKQRDFVCTEPRAMLSCDVSNGYLVPVNVISIKIDKIRTIINPLKPKRRPLYLNTQSVPRCKQFSSRL